VIALAQHSKPDTIVATYIPEKISFDGKLNESFWHSASIENFIQRNLLLANPLSEKTKSCIVL